MSCLTAAQRSEPLAETEALKTRIQACDDAAVLCADMSAIIRNPDVLAESLPSGHAAYDGYVLRMYAERLVELIEMADYTLCTKIIGLLKDEHVERIPVPSHAAVWLTERLRDLGDLEHKPLVLRLYERALAVMGAGVALARKERRLLLDVLRDAVWYLGLVSGERSRGLKIAWRGLLVAAHEHPLEIQRILMELPESLSAALVGEEGSVEQRIARFAGKEEVTTPEAAEIMGLSHDYFRQRVQLLPEGMCTHQGKPKRFDTAMLIALALAGFSFPGNSTRRDELLTSRDR